MVLNFKNLHGTRVRFDLNGVLNPNEILVNNVIMRYSIEQNYNPQGQIYTKFVSKVKYTNNKGQFVCTLKGEANSLNHITHLAINDKIICNGFNGGGVMHPSDLDYHLFLNEIIKGMRSTNQVPL